jgi:hypothetical protein
MKRVPESIFTKIYKEKVWGEGTLSSPLSGLGSAPEMAKPYVDLVSKIVKSLNITSILDIGHGDWVMWQDYKFEDTKYFGIDIAEDIGDQNTKIHGNENTHFKKVSSQDKLDRADLALCKDVFQHLSHEDIRRILSQSNNFNHIVICNDVTILNYYFKLRYFFDFRNRYKSLLRGKSPFFIKMNFNNSQISSGGYRTLDIENSEFAKYLSSFELINKLDYISDNRKQVRKRILFYSKKKSPGISRES